MKKLKILFLLSIILLVTACGTTGHQKAKVEFSTDPAKVQMGASVTPKNLVVNENLRQIRFATCVAEQLSLTKGGAKLVQGFLNTTQAGYRESQYVNGVRDWEKNLAVGGALSFIQYLISKRAENARVSQNVSLAEANCGKMLSSVVKLEADADAALQAKMNLNINIYNTSQKVSPQAKTYLCEKLGSSRFCGGK